MVALTPKGQFLGQLDFIDRVVDATSRQHGLFGDDADDFKSAVHEKLIADDYAVFRKFRGNSALETYLTAVIKNRFRDHRIAKWGKWRPSAKARKMGPAAVQLESLLYRDGRSLEEACEILQDDGDGNPSRAELARLAAALPPRPARRFEEDDGVAHLPSADETNGLVLDGERAARWSDVEDVLQRAFATLPDEDRVVMRMRFLDGFSVAGIARALALDQRPLYDRIERITADLRQVMLGQGITESDVAELVE